jgi:hypothetical protein
MKQLYPIIIILFLASTLFTNHSFAQDKPVKEYTYQTFKDTRVINTYSTETLRKKTLDVRIAHRFGDYFNQWQFQNAWTNFFGFENAADVGMGVEYGITDNFMMGFHRTKGAGPLKSLLHLIAKYKVLAQTKDNKMPISMAIAGSVSVSTMWASDNPQLLSNVPGGFGHRMIYSLQVHVARKFGEIFSLQISPTFVWRNLVVHDDNNFLASASVCAKIQVTKALGIILDANFAFDAYRWTNSSTRTTNYYFPLGIGFEIETGGGHVFQINLSNSAGIEPTDYIPNTTLDWTKGQFRIGFTISRAFKM